MARWKDGGLCEHCGEHFAHYQSYQPRFCSLRCSSLHHYQLNPREHLSAREVFEQRVLLRLVEDSSGCLLWTGAKNSQGYGQTSIGNRREYVHRLAWKYYGGRELADGEFVLHHCDTPLCARFEHLFVGTHRDNMRDAMEKGRMIRGERVATSKLTEAEVLEILRIYRAGGVKQVELGQQFGVSRTAIGHVVKGRTWKHLGK